jgi:hypothetical protein
MPLQELSKDQMMAVHAGITAPNMSWDVVEMPQWPFKLPDWVLDARIDWMEGYSNNPQLHIMVTEGAWDFEKRYNYDPKTKLYIALDDAGERISVHSHGPLSEELIETKFLSWGKYPDGRPNYNERIVEKELRWVTRQEQGSGGRHFPITMADGRKAILRGPWHIGTPKGYEEPTMHEVRPLPKFRNTARQKFLKEKGIKRKWDNGGSFGTGISNDLYARIVSRFLPHLRLAIVRKYGYETMVPRIAGQAPKGYTIEGQDLSGD